MDEKGWFWLSPALTEKLDVFREKNVGDQKHQSVCSAQCGVTECVRNKGEKNISKSFYCSTPFSNSLLLFHFLFLEFIGTYLDFDEGFGAITIKQDNNLIFKDSYF